MDCEIYSNIYGQLNVSKFNIILLKYAKWGGSFII